MNTGWENKIEEQGLLLETKLLSYYLTCKKAKTKHSGKIECVRKYSNNNNNNKLGICLYANLQLKNPLKLPNVDIIIPDL